MDGLDDYFCDERRRSKTYVGNVKIFTDECVDFSPPINRSEESDDMPFPVMRLNVNMTRENYSSMPDLSRINSLPEGKLTDWRTNGNSGLFPDIGKKERYTERSSFSRFLNFLPANKKRLEISSPGDVQCVSQIIEADKLPKDKRRIRLCKRKSDQHFGLYIRDGWRADEATKDVPKVPGVFVSRFASDGLAERSGLLSVNDEILEINGTTVTGMPLKEVYKVMVANAENLILTIQPKSNEPSDAATIIDA